MILIQLFWSFTALSNNTWVPDFTTLQGRLEFLSSLFLEYPNLPRQNLSFKRNPLDTVSGINSIVDQLELSDEDIEIDSNKIFGGTYSSSGDTYIDNTKISSLKETLINSIDKLPEMDMNGIESDIFTLKSIASQSGAKDVLKLIPFLYDSNQDVIFNQIDTDAKEKIKQLIQNIDSSELDNFYNDLYETRLKEEVQRVSTLKKQGMLKEAIASHESNFLNKELKPALTLYSREGQVSELRSISLEKIPKVYSPFRGCVANDCSILSVPYYGLVEDAEVFWIRKSLKTNHMPDGYILIVNVILDGEKIPYVVTVNGTRLTTLDTLQAVKLYLREKKIDKVILPNFSMNKFVVNTNAVRDGLTVKNSKDVEVEFPSAWKEVEQYQDRNTNGYDNYYKSESLKSAKLAHLEIDQNDFISFSETEKIIRYIKPESLEEQDLLNRSLLAINATTDSKFSSDASQTLELLNVDQENIRVAKYLVEATAENPITADKFDELESMFEFKISDIDNLDLFSKGPSIRDIYFNRNNSTEDIEQIKKMSIRYLEELGNELETYIDIYKKEGGDNYKNAIEKGIYSLTSIPDELLDSRYSKFLLKWLEDENFPFKNTLISNIIANFKSAENIDPIINHLISFDDITDVINLERVSDNLVIFCYKSSIEEGRKIPLKVIQQISHYGYRNLQASINIANSLLIKENYSLNVLTELLSEKINSEKVVNDNDIKKYLSTTLSNAIENVNSPSRASNVLSFLKQNENYYQFIYFDRNIFENLEKHLGSNEIKSVRMKYYQNIIRYFSFGYQYSQITLNSFINLMKESNYDIETLKSLLEDALNNTANISQDKDRFAFLVSALENYAANIKSTEQAKQFSEFISQNPNSQRYIRSESEVLENLSDHLSKSDFVKFKNQFSLNKIAEFQCGYLNPNACVLLSDYYTKNNVITEQTLSNLLNGAIKGEYNSFDKDREKYLRETLKGLIKRVNDKEEAKAFFNFMNNENLLFRYIHHDSELYSLFDKYGINQDSILKLRSEHVHYLLRMNNFGYHNPKSSVNIAKNYFNLHNFSKESFTALFDSWFEFERGNDGDQVRFFREALIYFMQNTNEISNMKTILTYFNKVEDNLNSGLINISDSDIDQFLDKAISNGLKSEVNEFKKKFSKLFIYNSGCGYSNPKTCQNIISSLSKSSDKNTISEIKDHAEWIENNRGRDGDRQRLIQSCYDSLQSLILN